MPATRYEDGFQPTRPLRGATFQRLLEHRISAISTHAPLAGRDQADKRERVREPSISTHAPLAGRDNKQSRNASLRIEFQPTRPLRGATIAFLIHVTVVTFQPTRPLRGATKCRFAAGRRSKISTHAPLAGRDCPGQLLPRLLHAISTHAPLAGRDMVLRFSPHSSDNFNPRAPCGARPSPALLISLSR